jgi:filamentous hemagglutinin
LDPEPKPVPRHVEDVIANPSTRRVDLERGRQAWWDSNSGTVVIRDPNRIDGGTTFRPSGGYRYFEGLE